MNTEPHADLDILQSNMFDSTSLISIEQKQILHPR